MLTPIDNLISPFEITSTIQGGIPGCPNLTNS